MKDVVRHHTSGRAMNAERVPFPARLHLVISAGEAASWCVDGVHFEVHDRTAFSRKVGNEAWLSCRKNMTNYGIHHLTSRELHARGFTEKQDVYTHSLKGLCRHDFLGARQLQRLTANGAKTHNKFGMPVSRNEAPSTQLSQAWVRTFKRQYSTSSCVVQACESLSLTSPTLRGPIKKRCCTLTAHTTTTTTTTTYNTRTAFCDIAFPVISATSSTATTSTSSCSMHLSTLSNHQVDELMHCPILMSPTLPLTTTEFTGQENAAPFSTLRVATSPFHSTQLDGIALGNLSYFSLSVGKEGFDC